MLLSLACLFTFAIGAGLLFTRLGLPRIIGMLLAGILIGPYGWNLLASPLLEHSADIRKLALVIILIKAGLSIKWSDFQSIGRPALLMAFLPACAEGLAYTLLAPIFFDISYSEAALMGSVLAAVSPAVVVPRMVEMIEQTIGSRKKIPQLILAGASLDDVVVIVLFSALLGFTTEENLKPLDLANIPISILTSIVIGVLAGMLFAKLLKHFQRSLQDHPHYQHLLLLSLALALTAVETSLSNHFPYSGLLAVLVMAVQFNQAQTATTRQSFSQSFARMWGIGEIFLFVLVGAIIDVNYTLLAGLPALLLIILTLLIRSVAVLICVSGTGLNRSEKLFCVIAYLPKATVQAAIGGIPLAMGIDNGKIILSVAVLGILLTAPLGAILLDRYGKALLD